MTVTKFTQPTVSTFMLTLSADQQRLALTDA